MELLQYRKKEGAEGRWAWKGRKGGKKQKGEGRKEGAGEGGKRGRTSRKTGTLSSKFALGTALCCMVFVYDPVQSHKDPLFPVYIFFFVVPRA